MIPKLGVSLLKINKQIKIFKTVHLGTKEGEIEVVEPPNAVQSFGLWGLGMLLIHSQRRVFF
jgi:hypothetical protein